MSHETDEGHPEPSTEEEAAEPRPDPRQPAYDAVYAYIRSTNRVPGDLVTRNAMIWRAVNAALDATPVGRCISSHCVEGDHILDLDSGPSVREAADNDRRWFDCEKEGE